jgi:hypothetical protein
LLVQVWVLAEFLQINLDRLRLAVTNDLDTAFVRQTRRPAAAIASRMVKGFSSGIADRVIHFPGHVHLALGML